MQTELIVVSEYCIKCNIEPSFIDLLADEGLIDVQLIEGIEYIKASQLPDLERYIRWHYDLSINVAGIDTIRYMLMRMEKMQKEIHLLRRHLSSLSKTDIGFDDF